MGLFSDHGAVDSNLAGRPQISDGFLLKGRRYLGHLRRTWQYTKVGLRKPGNIAGLLYHSG